MKRQDLSLNQIIAYKTRRDNNPNNIYQAKILDLRSGTRPILVEIETFGGKITTDELQLWQVMGDYAPTKAAHDLRQAQIEINRLKKEIANKDRATKLERIKPLLTETLQIPAYKVRTHYTNSEITLELTDTTLDNLVRLIQDNNYQTRRIAFLEERLDLAPKEVNA